MQFDYADDDYQLVQPLRKRPKTQPLPVEITKCPEMIRPSVNNGRNILLTLSKIHKRVDPTFIVPEVSLPSSVPLTRRQRDQQLHQFLQSEAQILQRARLH